MPHRSHGFRVDRGSCFQVWLWDCKDTTGTLVAGLGVLSPSEHGRGFTHPFKQSLNENPFPLEIAPRIGILCALNVCS